MMDTTTVNSPSYLDVSLIQHILFSFFTNQNENPPPAVISSNTLHMGNAPGEDTTKGTGQRCGTEEQSNAIMLLIAFIPHRQVEYHAGEKTTFCDTEEETRR